MAENDLLNGVITSANVTSNVALFGEIFLYAIVGIAVIGLIYLVYYLTTFKHTLIIRDAVHGRKVISKKKWKEKRGKDNNIWLITPFNRIKKPLPPTDAVEITARGRKWVEAWRGEDTESLIYIKDEFNYKSYKAEHSDFQPLTTQERELLIAQVTKAHSYKKKTTWERVVTIAIFMAPLLMIAIIGLTLGDITEALTEYSKPLTNSLATTSQAFVEASNNLANIQTPEVIINPEEVPN